MRARSGVLAVVCLGHVGLILLLSTSSPGHRQRGGVRESEQEPMLLVWIDELIRRDEPVAADSRVSNSAHSDLVAPSSVPDFDIVEPITSGFDAGDVPRLDWSEEATRSTGTAIEQQLAREKLVAPLREKLAGHRKGMDVFAGTREHKPGDTERFEGGETITWINDRCYYSTLKPPGPDAGQLSFQKPICKPRSPKAQPRPRMKAEREESSIPYQNDRNALPF